MQPSITLSVQSAPAPLIQPHPRRRSLRSGFTAIELLMVIGIMMILMSIATPSVVTALRRGTVNNAANNVMQCWRQARSLAMTCVVPDAPNGFQPKHYGVVIVADAANGSYAAMIYGNTAINTPADAAGAILRVDPTGPADDIANPPVAKYKFNANVQVRSAALGDTAVDAAERTLAVYAQYRTGVPIAPVEVVGGSAPTASPISVGLGSNTTYGLAGSPITPVLQLQTLDFSTVAVKRGYALRLTLFPVGVLATQEL